MTTTAVSYSLDNPSAAAVPHTAVTARLRPAGVRGDLVDDTTVVVGAVTVTTNAAGTFTITLIPNIEYQTTGSYYEVKIAGGPTYTVVVPVSASPVSLWDCIVDPATLDPVPPDAPSMYLLRAELGAPLGPASLGVDGLVDPDQLPPGNGGSAPDATTTSKGIVQLAGDLAGTAAAPTVPGKAATVHTHAAGDITSGTLAVARIPTGSTASTVCLGNDARLSDARTPTAHASTHASAGSDPVTPAAIGAAAAAHGHAIGDVTGLAAALADTVPPARLITAGTGLTGGGSLAADRTLTVAYGTTSTTAARGDDNRITGALQASIVDAKGDLLAATAADTVARLAAGSDGQVLTADSSQGSGLRWATPSVGGSLDPAAARYGLLAATILPADIAAASEEVRLVQERLHAYWLPLPAGTTVTGVRLPVVATSSGVGAIYATVYQEDQTQLGASGDVATALSAGSGTEWRSIPLGAPAATTGDGVWITLLSTVSVSTSLTVLFGSGADNLPAWACNPSWRRTALRTEGITTPPATYNPAGATNYVDFVIGVY